VIYVSEKTAASKWVEWEVAKCKELGKKIIAVHAGDKQPLRMPDWIKSNSIKVVPWSKLASEIT
jgi:hypothetical protein